MFSPTGMCAPDTRQKGLQRLGSPGKNLQRDEGCEEGWPQADGKTRLPFSREAGG